MKCCPLHILVIIGISLRCVSIGAPENPNVSTSFRANTTVPSENQQRRLVSRPNPVSTSGNDVITGNVGGMKYFRGVVPYGSTYYNRADIDDAGSAAVSAFLRRSVNPVLSDRNPGQSRVFYESRRAVSSFQVQNIQRSALTESIATGQSRKSTYLVDFPEVASIDNPQRPLSSDTRQLDHILTRQFELKEEARESNRKRLQQKDSDFQNFFEITLKPETTEEPTLKVDDRRQPQEETRQDPRVREIDQRQETIDAAPAEATEMELDLLIPEQVPIRRDPLQALPQTEMEDDLQPEAETEGIDREEVRERTAEHAEAQRIRGEHSTLDSLARSRFTDYMQAGEAFMQEGRFYKAADTYNLAALWQPEDPRPYMAQSFALFAAGEYMSSAYYLSRAIEINTAMASKPYDLPGLIGDRDVFENRLLEMTTWQQRSDSGELAFLMAYILYHDGKPAQAKAAIQEAEKQMPDNSAVSTVKKMIIPNGETTP